MNIWDARFLALAAQIAQWSKDPSTRCGCVIVDPQRRIVSTGYNGFPRGTDDSAGLLADRERRLARTIHAEMNAILCAPHELVGCTLYVWPMPPCVRCATAIAQAGIVRVVSPPATADLLMRWGESIAEARAIFAECGIEVFEGARAGIGAGAGDHTDG